MSTPRFIAFAQKIGVLPKAAARPDRQALRFGNLEHSQHNTPPVSSSPALTCDATTKELLSVM